MGQAGIAALNVSRDSLRPEVFKEVTGVDRFDAVMERLEKVMSAGFSRVKINAVLLRFTPLRKPSTFMELIQGKP